MSAYSVAELRLRLNRADCADWTIQPPTPNEPARYEFRNAAGATALVIAFREPPGYWVAAIPSASGRWEIQHDSDLYNALEESLRWIKTYRYQYQPRPPGQ